MFDSTPSATRRRAPSVRSAVGLMILTYLGFISLGLPDAAFGVAWPTLRMDFGLAENRFGLALLMVGAGFVVSSLSAGSLLKRFGVGVLLAGSTATVACGLVGFALAPSFGFFLAAAILVGLGGGAIDAGLNAYAASHYSARDMNWLHAAFGFGAAISPFVMTAAVTSSSWRIGYAVVAAVMVILALLFALTRNAFQDGTAQASPLEVDVPMRAKGRSRRLVALQVSLFFLYAGTEIAFGQWAYTILTQSRDYADTSAGFWTGGYWFALFLGRLLLGFGAERIGTDNLLIGGFSAALLGAIVFAVNPVGLGHFGLLLVGFSLAPVFPLLIHKTPRIFAEPLAAKVVGYQVSAAMAGGVAIPAAFGLLAGRIGLAALPVSFLVCAFVLVAIGTFSVGKTRSA